MNNCTEPHRAVGHHAALQRITAEETIAAVRELLWPDGIAGEPWDSSIGDDVAAELYVYAMDPASDGEQRSAAEVTIADLIATLWPDGLGADTEWDSSIGDDVGAVLRLHGFGPDREECAS